MTKCAGYRSTIAATDANIITVRTIRTIPVYEEITRAGCSTIKGSTYKLIHMIHGDINGGLCDTKTIWILKNVL